jgi:hypothetical protein
MIMKTASVTVRMLINAASGTIHVSRNNCKVSGFLELADFVKHASCCRDFHEEIDPTSTAKTMV